MRLLTCVLALCALVLAQDPEGFPTGTTTTFTVEITPKTWAQSATSRPPTIASYSAPPVSWTTITSGSVIYKVAITPTVVYSTITSSGGVLEIPITSAAVPSIIGTPHESPVPSSTHKTRTIVLSVIFSFIGAVLLLIAAMFLIRVRAQRKMQNNRSWAMRPGGWVDESKQGYPMDLETNLDRNPHQFPEPQVPAPAPSHTRQRSL